MVDLVTHPTTHSATSPPPPVRLALYQGQAKLFDVDANLATVKSVCTLAKQQHQADIVLFPELFLHGYELDSHYTPLVQQTAITADGAVIGEIQKLAAELQVAICISYIERGADTKIYNSCSLIDYTGRLQCSYRKTHLWWKQEKAQFVPGDRLQPVLKLPLSNGRSIQTSIAICYDIEFPETTRTLALNGCELVLAPTALTVSDKFVTPFILLRARAYESHMYLAYCNLIGNADLSHLDKPLQSVSPNDFIGSSGVINPAGAELVRGECSKTAQADQPQFRMPFDKLEVDANSDIIRLGEYSQLLLCDVDPAYWKDKHEQVDYLNDRRPELYAK